MVWESINPKIRATFDAEWYYSQYNVIIDKLRSLDEDIFDFYLRVGARLGHDPHAEFSEILYRHRNHDVYVSILERRNLFGYAHFVDIGYSESLRVMPSSAERALCRKISACLDPEFLEQEYSIDSKRFISPIDFYFLQVSERRISPSPMFSEEAYRQDHPDVDEAVKAGFLPSGFAHFIDTLVAKRHHYSTVAEHKESLRKKELKQKRTILEANIPGVTHPHALDALKFFEMLTKDVTIELENGQDLGMVVLLPHFLPEILFGGYLAFFDFLSALKRKCQLDLRLIVVNAGSYEAHKQNVMRMKIHGDKSADIFSSTQFLSTDRVLSIPAGYKIMSYCAETHYLADQIARRIGELPFFFIQEYEPDFHAKGDGFTFTKNAFSLPHFGIYNTKILCDFFLDEGQMRALQGPDYSWCSFENHVEKISIGKQEFIEKRRRKNKRQLVFYGRPEPHAIRNHFATFVLGLRAALDKGYFDAADWSFVSVGSLTYEGELPLGGTRKLEIVTKMPYTDYVDFLETGDIGVSFISTPHPGIVHFQMANYGLVTVTNTTTRRSADWLRSVNGNLMGVDLSPSAIAEGLRQAIERADDLETRYENARGAPYATKEDCLQPAVASVAARFQRPASPVLAVA